MTAMRRLLITGFTVLALGGLLVPAATAGATAAPAPVNDIEVRRTWHATVQCQIVRISDNHVVGYERGDGVGNSRQNAINDAKRNVPVPPGHYKRHCDAKRVW